MKALICGGIAVDDIRLPSTMLTGVVGGSAIYGSLASQLFTQTILGGAIGHDFPHDFLEFLKRKHIDISHLVHSKKPSFRWKGQYSEDLSILQTTDQRMNAFEDFKLDGLQHAAKNCGVVFISNIDPSIQLELIQQLPSKVVKTLDSMDLWIVEKREALKRVLRQVDVFFVSMEEATLLVESRGPILAMVEKIMTYGPKTVVLKKGQHGLTMYGRMGTFSIPSYPLAHVVDPSGAGDSLGGAIAGILARLGRFDQDAMKTALFLGNVIASFVIEDYATKALHDITIKEVVNRAKTFLHQLPDEHELLLDQL